MSPMKTSHKFQSIRNLFKHRTSPQLAHYPTPPGSPTVQTVPDVRDGASSEADLVALLGNTDPILHQQAAKILQEVVNESMPVSDETTLLIVALLNNPSEDVSENTRELLFSLSHYGAIQNCLTRQNTIWKLLDFMGSKLIHVQCCVMAIFAVLVHEKNIRAVLLDNQLLPVISNLLNNDAISTRMLHLLLWSLGQFVNYDDLRGPILQTGTVYALARLRSFDRLPEESNTMLSQLITDEELLLSFHSDGDDPPVSPVTAFHCLVGAQEAMDMVQSDDNANALRNLLATYGIAPQDYVVQVGFNEELLDSGGYLEEIYIYLAKEAQGRVSRMLNGLAELFQPLPCVLLTPEHAYRTPTPPALPLGLNGIILQRGKRDYTVLALKKQGVSEPQDGGCSKSGQDGDSEPQEGGGSNSGEDEGSADDNSSGNGDGESKSTSPNDNSGSAGHDKGKAGKRSRKEIPVVRCNSNMIMSIPTLATSNPASPNTQAFGMFAVLTVDVQPDDDIDSRVILEFKTLDAKSQLKDARRLYQHTKIKVVVDSEDERVTPYDYGPMDSTATGPTVMHTHSREWNRGGSISIGARTGISGTANINRRANDTDKTVTNIQRIIVYCEATKVTWHYDACDTCQQQYGMRVKVGKLPVTEFWPKQQAKVHKPFHIELRSHWSTRMPEKGSKFLSLPAFWKDQPVPLLRNFCHVTCMKLSTDLSKKAILQLQLNASMPSSEDSAISTYKISSSDVSEATVDGDVEHLDPVGVDSGGRRLSRLLRLHRR